MAGKARKTERRHRSRHETARLLPVRIVLHESGHGIDARVEDVSTEGLGIGTARELSEGTVLRFETLAGNYLFNVAWCRQEGMGPRKFKCGLKLAEGGIADLTSLFSSLIEMRDAV